MLDVNAGIPLADEPGILARTIQLVQSLVDVPLSIDSSIVEALEAAKIARGEEGHRFGPEVYKATLDGQRPRAEA